MVEKEERAAVTLQQVKKKKSHKGIIIAVVILLILAGLTGVHLYIRDYYHATRTAEVAAAGDSAVSVTKSKHYYSFAPTDPKLEKKGGIIFYPGAKVEETAYAPLLKELASQGYEVFLARMPAHLAIFGQNRADEIIENNPHITEWTMMGHSLGGAMAASYASSHEEEIDSLVLLAAYSTKDLSESGMQVLQVYGSRDLVLNMDSVEKYADYLPEDALTYVIDGGNHANYAYYGEQKGDGEATITREEQQEELLDLMAFYGF